MSLSVGFSDLNAHVGSHQLHPDKSCFGCYQLETGSQPCAGGKCFLWSQTSAVLSLPDTGEVPWKMWGVGLATSVLARKARVASGQLLGLARDGLVGPGADPRHNGTSCPGETLDSKGLCCLHDVGGRVGTKTSGENSSQLSCVLGWDAD